MVFDPKKKSLRGLTNFDFVVQIDNIYNTLDNEIINMGVDAVRGLGDPRTNVVRHRADGLMSSVMGAHPGLSTAENVTLEGIYLADLNDLKVLKKWHNQCMGKETVDVLGGFRREITIKHMSRAAETQNNFLQDVQQFSLQNCICVRLGLGDLDSNAEGFATWTMEIAFDDFVIGDV